MSPPAFADFVGTHRGALLRFAMVLTGDARLTEDVVADVLARAYERWDRIAALDQPLAYVRRMIVNEHISVWRRWRRATPSGLIDALPLDGDDPAADLDLRAELVARLSGLTRKQRAVIVLRYYLDWSDTDIASTLGCSEGTVRTHASRALAQLRIDIAEAREHR